MPKILVIGSKGQLARSLFVVPESQSFKLVCTSRPDTDLTKPKSITKALDDHRPDFVINAAAYTQVDDAEQQEKMAYAVNAHGVKHLAKICAGQNIPLIHISTDYVYDGKKAEPYDETDATAPVGIYGQSKLAGEDAVRAASGPHLILRTAWVYSPYGKNFVKTMLNLAKTRNKLSVVNDQSGCPTYAPHLAQGILQIIRKCTQVEALDGVWGTYCVAGSGQTNWCDFATEIFHHSRDLKGSTAEVSPIPTTEFPTPAQRPANSRLDCGKLERQFGIRLPNWKQGTAECVSALLT